MSSGSAPLGSATVGIPACFASMTTMPKASRCSRRDGMQWIAAPCHQRRDVVPEPEKRHASAQIGRVCTRIHALAVAFVLRRHPPGHLADDIEAHVVPALHEHPHGVEQQIQTFLRDDLADINDPSRVAVRSRLCTSTVVSAACAPQPRASRAGFRARRARGSVNSELQTKKSTNGFTPSFQSQ